MRLLCNAKIRTIDSSKPTASAILIDRGRIIAVGDDRQLQDLFNAGKGLDPDAEAVDLDGRVVLPGLTDAHIHLEQYALGLQIVDCETNSREECIQRVAARAAQTPPGVWILGHGWNQNSWPGGFGNFLDLDRIAPNNPVYLTAKSLHAAWVNSYALRLGNVLAHPPDPPGGRIGRDGQGKPDGILFESAMQVVSALIPAPTSQEVESAITLAQPILWRMGLTGVHDFDRRRCFVALQNLHQASALKLRVIKSIPIEDLSHAVSLGLHSGFGDDFLRIGSVKAFADGALGPRTAAMLQAYSDEPDNHGMLLLDAEELFEKGQMAVENGLSLAVHAIGDRANHEILNGFAQLREFEKSNNVDLVNQADHPAKTERGRLRHRIEHVQLIHPDDADRLSKLGIIASMQPIHAPSDMLMADRYWGQRSKLAYAWRTQLDHGAVMAFGSDAPVESPNPLWGIEAAVTRQRFDGTPGPDGWQAEQRIPVLEAIQGFTTGAAYAAGLEDRLGKLKEMYLADLIVLEEDPFQCEPRQIHLIRPVGTMVNGEWVFKGF